jgi:hypothetical protein
MNDTFILPHHSEAIYQKYSGEKIFKRVECDHNDPRPNFYMHSVAIFFYNALYCEFVPDPPVKNLNRSENVQRFELVSHELTEAALFQNRLLHPEEFVAENSDED